MAKLQLQRLVHKDRSDVLSAGLVTLVDPAAEATEAYRSIRTSLFYGVVDVPPKVVLITSPSPAEGKSTTCANLAVVLAQAGKETLVIDGDLRGPGLHKIFGVPNVSGVVNVLSGEYDLSEVWKEPLSRLKLISTGPIPPDPTALFSSVRFAEFVPKVRQQFDYVLIDSPPTGMVSDPMIIATQADGVLLVLDAQETSKGALRKTVRKLEGVGANVLGTVMNKAQRAETGPYQYGY